VSREVTRHGGRPAYRVHEADEQAWESALRPKRCLLAVNRKLRNMVASKLMLDWSPEQISGWLKTQYPDDEGMRVSHETIYRSLFIQARGVLKKEVMDHLRSKRRMRRSRHATASGQSRGQIVDAISIRERPAEVEDRAIPGHWEGDLLSGAKNSYIATLVEGHSRFAMLIKVSSKDTEVVVATLRRHVRKLPTTLADAGSQTEDGQAQGLHVNEILFSMRRHCAALFRCAATACFMVQRWGSRAGGHFRCGAFFFSHLRRQLCRCVKIAAMVRPLPFSPGG